MITEFYYSLQIFGMWAIESFWFPILIWTVLSGFAFLVLKFWDSNPPIYHYHLRAALLLALPLGLISTLILQGSIGVINYASNFDAAIFVVEYPVESFAYGSTGNEQTALNWTERHFLIGLASAIIGFITLFFLSRLIWSYFQLIKLKQNLKAFPLSEVYGNKGSNLDYIKIAFHNHHLVPFTFGWKNPIIVLSDDLKTDPSKLEMAVEHELVHIKHGDYLLNLAISLIQSVFWFHPLIQFGAKEIETYREISCDHEVLNTTNVSPKQYAGMLYELLPLNKSLGTISVSMAVKQSTLKKRIETMKNHKLNKSSFKRSIALLLVMTIAIITPIACSDLRSPSGLSEEEILNSNFNISNYSVTINGNEIIPGLPKDLPFSAVKFAASDIVLIGAMDFGTFAVSALQFDGAVIAGSVQNSTINFTTNQLNVEIKSLAEPFLDNKTEIWVRHYPEKRTAGMRTSGTSRAALEDKMNSLANVPANRGGNPDVDDDFFVVVENMPKLVGGIQGVQAKVQYPEMAKRAGIEGRVTVQFIVNESGDVENAKILRGIGGGCDEEALAVVRGAKFEPGLQRGRPVRVQMSLPIVFRLTNADM